MKRGDAVAQPDPPFLDQHHHAGRRRDHLGERRQVEDGVERHRLDLRHERAVADGLLIHDLVAAPDQDHRARKASSPRSPPSPAARSSRVGANRARELSQASVRVGAGVVPSSGTTSIDNATQQSARFIAVIYDTGGKRRIQLLHDSPQLERRQTSAAARRPYAEGPRAATGALLPQRPRRPLSVMPLDSCAQSARCREFDAAAAQRSVVIARMRPSVAWRKNSSHCGGCDRASATWPPSGFAAGAGDVDERLAVDCGGFVGRRRRADRGPR